MVNGSTATIWPENGSLGSIHPDAGVPPRGWLHWLSVVFGKLAHIIIHCRKHFQFWLSTALAVYSFVNRSV